MDHSTAGERLTETVLSDADLDDVLATVVDVAVVVDEAGTVEAVADEGVPTLGDAPERLVGRSLGALFAADAAAPAFDVATAETFERTLVDERADDVIAPVSTADGGVVPLSFSTVPRDDPPGTVCLGSDVSDRIDGPWSDDPGRRPMDVVPDPVYVLDADDRFVAVNDAMVASTGYDRDELLGRGLAETLSASDHERATAHRSDLAAADGGAETFEATFVTRDGERMHVEAHVAARTDEDGDYVGSVGVFRELSERTPELREQVPTRVFRHKVRNELALVTGHAELLAEQIDEDLRQHTTEIAETADRLLRHSEKARRLERVNETDDLIELDLTDTVSTVVESAREEYPAATINVDLPAEATVTAHPDVAEAVWELVENAIEHSSTSPRSGAPEDAVEHAPDDGPRIDVWIDREAGTPTLFVEDQSGGIDDHEVTVLDRSAEPDLEHSSGLGLWLVRWLVDCSNAETIVHRTGEGTLIGIQFDARDPSDGTRSGDGEESPLADAPAHARDVSAERFRGDTVVGRVEASNRLDAAYEGLDRSGGHAVLVTGEAGIGKSTLVEQFRKRLSEREDPPLIATGVCDAEARSSYRAFRRLLVDLPTEREFAALLDDARSESVEDADELERRKRTLFADVADELRTVAADRPVVLFVEELQWADRSSVDLFEYLVEAVGEWSHPVLVVGTYRTGDGDRTHPVPALAEEMAQAGRGTVLELEPFAHDEVESLVAHVLDVDGVPESLVAAIHDHTDGMPLFVNELARHLADTLGPIESGADLPENLDDVAVPETVERAITERLDALPEAVWPVLRLGAVVGREFSFDVLRDASDHPTDSLVEAIDTLVRREIWTRSGERIAFVHGVVRERTLAAVDDADCEHLHESVAHAVETVHEGSLEEHAARLATHYEQVGEYHTAFEYARRAGDHAAEAYAQEAAIEGYERALSLAAEHGVADDAERAAVAADLGDVLKLSGEYDRAREYYEESLDGYRAAGDRQGEAKSLRKLGLLNYYWSEYDRAREYYEESLAIAQETGDREGEAETRKLLGNTDLYRGDLDAALEHYEESLAVARAVGDRTSEAGGLNNLGIVAAQRGNYDRAREYYEESLAIAREIDEQESQVSALNNLGLVSYYRGEYDRAREYYEESLAIAREIGDRRSVTGCLNNLGLVAKEDGEYKAARDYYERSLAIKREIGDKRGAANSLHNLGGIARRRGEYEMARLYYEESLGIAQEIGDRKGAAESRNNLGIVATRRGEYDEAREYHEESLAIARETGARQGEANSLDNLGTLATLRGEYDRAREYFERARDVYQELGDAAGEARSRTDLARLDRRRGDGDRARDRLTEALETALDVESVDNEARILTELGAIARERGAYDRAAARLEQSLATGDSDEYPLQRGKTHLERARLALAREDPHSARLAVEAARDAMGTVDFEQIDARVSHVAGRVAAAAGEGETARENWRSALETFEAVGASDDALETLRHLVESCRDAGDDEAASEYRERAERLFDDAPAPVRERHRDWLG